MPLTSLTDYQNLYTAVPPVQVAGDTSAKNHENYIQFLHALHIFCRLVGIGTGKTSQVKASAPRPGAVSQAARQPAKIVARSSDWLNWRALAAAQTALTGPDIRFAMTRISSCMYKRSPGAGELPPVRGNRRFARGKSLSAKGKRLVRRGKRLLRRGKRLFSEGKWLVARGKSLLHGGNRFCRGGNHFCRGGNGFCKRKSRLRTGETGFARPKIGLGAAKPAFVSGKWRV
jgi:hypothetical protein